MMILITFSYRIPSRPNNSFIVTSYHPRIKQQQQRLLSTHRITQYHTSNSLLFRQRQSRPQSSPFYSASIPQQQQGTKHDVAVSSTTMTSKESDINDQNDIERERQLWIDIGKRELQGLYNNFILDDWQLQAGGAIWEGYNVIVSAPTGAGKTLIGEMALHIAFQQYNKTGIYTTPLKALSNQKYMELSQTFGRINTGLSTGDISINKGARITVMTTEVYRNIAWRSSSSSSSSSSTITASTTNSTTGSTANNAVNVLNTKYGNNELQANAVVVLDEFHYMGQPGRGGVWEESIIVSPTHTQIIGLSATLSNADAIVSWMEYVTGRRTILINVPNRCRPVPLRYLFATKDGVYPLFREKDAGPGAPLGLLGYRGDGIPSTSDLIKTNGKKKKNGFHKSDSNDNYNIDDLDDTILNGKKIPKGLQVNPALRDAAERRMDRINRSIERLKIRNYSSNGRNRNGNDDDYDSFQRSNKKRFNVKEEQKERERLLKKEMRRAVPSMYSLMLRLRQKELLPAIFFIFSRNGCDEAARMVYRYMTGSHHHGATTSDREWDVDENDDISSSSSFMNDRPRRNGRSTVTRKSILQNRNKNQNSNIDGLIRDSNGRMFRPDSNFLSEDLILSSTNYNNNDENNEATLTISNQKTEDKIRNVLEDTDTNNTSSILLNGDWDYYAKSGLLSYEQVCETAYRISIFNKYNVEIAFDDDLTEQYLFGIGSHHAGMLPAHKSFVELLFRNQLLKVVFATETLAAGINMPARTTVICSMAKRVNGGSTMALLETSNLLQMAGRAGRRGMDTDGTCVLVATPFETHDDAAKILTDPILPISSQFSPSYALCVNLIARGDGELVVAKQLVSKSFAMWERRQAEDDMTDLLGNTSGDLVNETLQAVAHENFTRILTDTFKQLIDQRTSKYDVSRLRDLHDVLSDLKLLKKTSKSFVGTSKMLEIEKITLAYLEKELESDREERSTLDGVGDEFMQEIFDENEPDLLHQIEIQQNRASSTEHEVKKHPFTAIATIASMILVGTDDLTLSLSSALKTARGDSMEFMIPTVVTPEELSMYAKSAVVLRRKTKKLVKSNPGIDPDTLFDEVVNAKEITEDTWDDFIAITRTLIAFGCVSTKSSLNPNSDLENEIFELTTSGLNVGMLSFDNSLWALVAMGGAWDVTGASSELDQLDDELQNLDTDDEDTSVPEQGNLSSGSPISIPKAQEDAYALVSLLKRMSLCELAGYVSCFISDDSRSNGNGASVVELFQRLTPLQQQVVQKSLNSLERLIEVQKIYSVDEATRNCNL
jgi:superfamily II RNA helicase